MALMLIQAFSNLCIRFLSIRSLEVDESLLILLDALIVFLRPLYEQLKRFAEKQTAVDMERKCFK